MIGRMMGAMRKGKVWNIDGCMDKESDESKEN